MGSKSASDYLLKYWDKRLPVDVEAIADAAGVSVVRRFPDGDESLSGIYTLSEDEGPVIQVNPEDNPSRQRFTIAHELGHHALRHGRSFRDPSKNFSSSAFDPREVAANRFAAAILMPKDLVEFLIFRKGITDIDALRSYFSVSRTAMTYRLRNLGLVD